MLLDDRSFPYSVSVQLITEQLSQISFINGLPSYACYKVPSYKQIKTTKVLWDSEEEFEEFFEQAASNSSIYAGTNILTNASISQSKLYIEGQEYFSGSVEYTSFPDLDSYKDIEETIETKKVNVIGFTLDGTPIWGDENKGATINIKKTVDANWTFPQNYYGNPSAISEIKKQTKSNYRYINGILYYDLAIEIQELS